MSERKWVPKIMVIEDNHDMNTYIAGMLVLKGAKVHKVHSYEECLQVLRELKWDIDAVVLGGKMAMERGDADKAKLLDLGSDDSGKKPLSGETVAHKVLMLLAKKYASSS
jgi:DNA-binding response OmpR family regulator